MEIKSIFWYDYWMNESPLIYKLLPNTDDFINHQAKVTDFVTTNKHWNLSIPSG